MSVSLVEGDHKAVFIVSRFFLKCGLRSRWNSKICELKKNKMLRVSGRLDAKCITGSLGDVSHAAETSGLQAPCCELASDGERLAAVGSLAEVLMYVMA